MRFNHMMIITGSYCTSYWIILSTSKYCIGSYHIGTNSDRRTSASWPRRPTARHGASRCYDKRCVKCRRMPWQHRTATYPEALEAEQEQELEIHEDHDDTED